MATTRKKKAAAKKKKLPSTLVRGSTAGHQSHFKSKDRDNYSPGLTGTLAAGRIRSMSDAGASRKITKMSATLGSFSSKTNNRKKKSTKK